MDLISITQKALLHRELYVAILNSLLKEPGSKTKLAKRAGISPVYLSYILSLDREPYNTSKYPIMRTPSPKVIERIVHTISAPSEIKQSLLHHMILSHEKRHCLNQLTCSGFMDKHTRLKIIKEVKQIYYQAQLNRDPIIIERLHRLGIDIASNALRRVSPKYAPLDFAELCYLVRTAQVVRNKIDDALWHAKLARFVLESSIPNNYNKQSERFDVLLTHTLMDEAHSYYILNQPKVALSLFEKMQTYKSVNRSSTLLTPIISARRISAIRTVPRFSITEVENIAYQGFETYEKNKVENVYIHFYISLEIIRAYIKHRNYKKAEKLLHIELARIDAITQKIGVGNRVRLLLTSAQFCSIKGDVDGWKHFIAEAYSLANGGFHLQTAKIEAEIKKFQNLNGIKFYDII